MSSGSRLFNAAISASESEKKREREESERQGERKRKGKVLEGERTCAHKREASVRG